LRKRRDVIPSGMAQRDEREQTVDDVSKAYRRCRNRGEVVNPGRVWGCPDCGPGGIRHDGGVTLNRALARNVGPVAPMRRERSKREAPARIGVPMRGTGAEQPVLVMKAL